jgi:hypothetical protein
LAFELSVMLPLVAALAWISAFESMLMPLAVLTWASPKMFWLSDLAVIRTRRVALP